MTSIPGQPR